jgi:hypothetical protein
MPTCHPSPASLRANASPIPEEAPTITAVGGWPKSMRLSARLYAELSYRFYGSDGIRTEKHF